MNSSIGCSKDLTLKGVQFASTSCELKGTEDKHLYNSSIPKWEIDDYSFLQKHFIFVSTCCYKKH